VHGVGPSAVAQSISAGGQRDDVSVPAILAPEETPVASSPAVTPTLPPRPPVWLPFVRADMAFPGGNWQPGEIRGLCGP